jgi:glucosamine 6-phosphate synthetase-like amidotransferase/phosphosugar isomerase protein
MAKKKKTIDFSNQNITFISKDETIKVLSLNLNSMDVEVLIINNEKKSVQKMPFAHLPKEIKKIVRPL